jgi:protease I
MTDLKDKKVAILVADMFEQVELTEPRKAVEDAGATTEVVSIEEGDVQGFDHYGKADAIRADRTVEEASADDYDALLLPGGVGNPDNLRQDENAVAFVRGFFEQGKPVAAICHAPWTLIEAGVVRGRTLTSFPSLQTDLRNAGANWVDEEVVVDGNLFTSRKPDDIPAFNRELTKLLAQGANGRQRRERAVLSRSLAVPAAILSAARWS